MLDAARIDGASNWIIFFRFLVPLSRAASATLVLLGVIGVVKIFEVPYLVTAGGPANATQFPSTYLFIQSVQNFNAGYAATIAIAMIVMSVVIAFAQVRRARGAASDA